MHLLDLILILILRLSSIKFDRNDIILRVLFRDGFSFGWEVLSVVVLLAIPRDAVEHVVKDVGQVCFRLGREGRRPGDADVGEMRDSQDAVLRDFFVHLALLTVVAAGHCDGVVALLRP